jgi:hypothetical protein
MPELRDFCKPRTIAQLEQLDRDFYKKTTPPWVRWKIAQLFAAYGYGHPINLAAVQLLDARSSDGDGGEVIIVAFEKAMPLDEFARETAPVSAARLEDLRLGPVSERKAKVEAELRENEREIERLTRLQEERGRPLDLDELRRAQDRANAEHKAAGNRVDPLSDWPGRSF